MVEASCGCPKYANDVYMNIHNFNPNPNPNPNPTPNPNYHTWDICMKHSTLCEKLKNGIKILIGQAALEILI